MIKNAKVVGPNVTYEVYSRQEQGVGRGHPKLFMSRSELVEFAHCPSKWKDGGKEDGEDDSTTATTWGTLIDTLTMTPERFDELFAVTPETYTTEKREVKPWNFNATVCKEWKEDHAGKEIIKPETLKNAHAAVKAVNDDPDVSALLRCSAKQVMCVAEWHDKNGIVVPIRCLLDLVPDKADLVYGCYLADFKTARNGDPNMWARVVDDNGYDVQAALSIDIYVEATKEGRNTWAHPVQENVKPYHVVRPMPALTLEFLAYGRAKYQAALKLYAHCLATNTWPSYSTGDRMVYGPVQLISPDSLWNYRQQAGFRGMDADKPEKPVPEPPLLLQ